MCGVQGRSIFDGLIYKDIIEYSEQKRFTGILTSVDQKKAFDMVDHGFLFRVLLKLGFNPELVQLIQQLSMNMSTSIQVNVFLSNKVSIERGVRQGCPLSPTLYIIYIQAFLNLFKAGNVTGLHMPGSERAIFTAYADDLLFFVMVHQIY